MPRLGEREKCPAALREYERLARPRQLRSKYRFADSRSIREDLRHNRLNALFVKSSCKSKSPQTSRVQFLLPTELDWECAEPDASLAGFRESNR